MTSLTVCHVGLFVYLEPADRHGGREGPDDQSGDGPGQLRPVWTGYLVGGYRFLGGRCHPAACKSCVDGPAPFEAMGAVPH